MSSAIPTAATLALCLLSLAARAPTTIHVATCGDDSWSGLSDVCQAPDEPKATIQAGIDATHPGDTVLVLPGSYAGEGNKNLSFGGKAISLRSRDGAAVTQVDLQGGVGAVAYFLWLNGGEGQGTLIEGFTVVNAYVEQWGGDR